MSGGARSRDSRHPQTLAHFCRCRGVSGPVSFLRRIHSHARTFARSTISPALDEHDARNAEADADVMELLTEAGVVPQQAPHGLLTGAQDQSSGRLAEMHRHMRFVFERNQAAYDERTRRAGLPRERADCRMFDPVAAIHCERGVRRSGRGLQPGTGEIAALPDDYLVGHDLIGIFQIGWTALYEEVGMYAARTLIDVAGRLRCADKDIQSGLKTLRIAMSRQVQAGTPWRAEPSLDVIAMLDQPAWAALAALIAECPVIHDALTASLTHRRAGHRCTRLYLHCGQRRHRQRPRFHGLVARPSRQLMVAP